MPTVAEHLAIASPFGSLEQCRPQRFRRQTQNDVQSTNVDFAHVRRETVERIDIRPYQPRHRNTGQRIRFLESP
jgi:hypothetical protein